MAIDYCAGGSVEVQQAAGAAIREGVLRDSFGGEFVLEIGRFHGREAIRSSCDRLRTVYLSETFFYKRRLKSVSRPPVDVCIRTQSLSGRLAVIRGTLVRVIVSLRARPWSNSLESSQVLSDSFTA